MSNVKRLIRTTFLLLLTYSMQHATAQIHTLNGKKLSTTEIDAFVCKQMDSLGIPAISIAILQDGKVAYYMSAGIKNEKGDPVDSSTIFESASLTKPVFAYAVHKLALKNRISLDTPLFRYYPYDDIDYDDRYKLITARMVLSHTTGFPNWRSGELIIKFEPGTKYSYSGEGFKYLSLVVKHLLNKRVQDIIDDEVFRPLSINNSPLTTTQYVGDHIAQGLQDNKQWGLNGFWRQPNVAYGMYTEASNYAKFVLTLMKESRSSTSAFQQMSVPSLEIEPGTWMCSGIFMQPTPYGAKYSHSGNNNNRYNANFEFYKDRDLGYVYFINCHQEPAFTEKLNKFLEDGE